MKAYKISFFEEIQNSQEKYRSHIFVDEVKYLSNYFLHRSCSNFYIFQIFEKYFSIENTANLPNSDEKLVDKKKELNRQIEHFIQIEKGGEIRGRSAGRMKIYRDNERGQNTRYKASARDPKRWRVDRFGTAFPLDRNAESLRAVPLSTLEHGILIGQRFDLRYSFLLLDILRYLTLN